MPDTKSRRTGPESTSRAYGNLADDGHTPNEHTPAGHTSGEPTPALEQTGTGAQAAHPAEDHTADSPLPHGVVRGRVLSAECPSRVILNHLTSRWGLLVLVVLRTGTHRFSGLRRQIEGVSERMLTQTLQQLEHDGMVVRKSFNTVPPHVEYSLTPWGAAAAERMHQLVDWLEENLVKILKDAPDGGHSRPGCLG